ncbi:S8 family serine peptidase [Streptomyces sp. NBC_01707]|uniref:S8 family serine peptidase n=1 Tax=unclassified Streptomyces TaxID=2593676 RepID=UPI0029BD02C2|nr:MULTISPECIES: S8 family serine peptidase [unclassified Streptomyces]MDX3765324.1 S8 family serine peptidase [Streptomyces sp. AK08-01B]MDX3814903.1 S8 family serine peptidase [Streptomyces sp. AK08-01A]
MHLPRSPRRRTAVWAAAVITATAALSGPATAFAQSAADPNPVTAKVDSALLDTVAKGKESTFFVVLKSQADLSAAKGKKSHAAKAKSAFASLRSEARNSQKPLQSFLDKEKVGYRSYWIANALEVTGGENLVDALAKRPDVASIVKEHTYKLDRTESKSTDAATDADPTAAEWGVQDIKADQVWDEYDDRGEGIVIANVDSGVQYDHPALVGNYRGNNGDGSFTHDYNWYDPTGQCTTSAPCDNNGHGTHTMGTMVGAGGVGVAPGAKWIAAKGCESSSCSDSSLLAAGQWILAPTDHTGQNPRPDLAPDIVNNSWGGGDTTFYQDIVEAWNAAGIFEAFAAGNDGNGTTCSTTHAPGSQAPAYGVGAYDSAGKIADFSGFGPSLVDGSAKPNISAPGVNIRSTWPGNTYRSINGTSMATPHVAGAVALLWSSTPSLIGDIDETRALLNQGARDVDDTHCGGTAGMNNVWGEGKLDIFASVDKAPHTAAVVTGTVTDKATGSALAGVTVKASGSASTRTVTTSADGSYRLTLPAGTYDFALSGYGYADGSASGVTVATGEQRSKDFALGAVASHAVSGTVLDVTGKPLAKATVRVAGTPVASVTTDASGHFNLPKVAEGSYTLTATPTAPELCNGVYSGSLAVDGEETLTARVPARSDAAGNSCAPATYSWIGGAGKVALSGDEDAKTITLPFPVKLYGVSYSSASVTTNGLINFLEPRLGDYDNVALPSAERPNGTVAAFWDDLVLDKKSTVQTATTGTTGNRKFAVVWNDAGFVGNSSARVSFEAVFEEATGSVTLQYQGLSTASPENGASATVGIENQAGTDALQYSYNEPVLKDRSAIRIAQGTK